ncbi:MAG: DegT/DnrJ/EryC1/StrS aminotransferase family protein [Bacteroidia bacterium]|nr:DegT/DnrJ/EryC1/StrS aminotransferase family protein [Bacteroidia bacterium]
MIPFSPPRIDQKIIDEVTDTLKSGWITTGPKTKRFEKALTAYCGNKATLCLNSATAGLEIMLRWFGVKEGDEVIVPAYTYCATANVVIHCGAKPVFVDIGDDFNISVSEIKKAITPNTKVIMPVDIAGLPCDMDSINALVNEPEIKKMFQPQTEVQKLMGRILVLSDAAHSVGGAYHHKKVGSLTDVSVLSFHAVKNLTTAEGGAICLNLPEPFDNDRVYQDLCIKTLHGQNKDALAKLQPGNWRYDIVEAGYKMNMTDIMASIGLVELERYETETLPRRKHIFSMYDQLLAPFNRVILPLYQSDDRCSSFHLYPLRIKGINEQQRDAIIAEIFKQQVSVNVHFIPVPMMSFYKQLGYNINNYPNTYRMYASEISLPVFYDLNDELIKQVAGAVVSAISKVLGTANE